MISAIVDVSNNMREHLESFHWPQWCVWCLQVYWTGWEVHLYRKHLQAVWFCLEISVAVLPWENVEKALLNTGKHRAMKT